jgi:hypothetical protein
VQGASVAHAARTKSLAASRAIGPILTLLLAFTQSFFAPSVLAFRSPFSARATTLFRTVLPGAGTPSTTCCAKYLSAIVTPKLERIPPRLLHVPCHTSPVLSRLMHLNNAYRTRNQLKGLDSEESDCTCGPSSNALADLLLTHRWANSE